MTDAVYEVVLDKACHDKPFDYALGLRSGLVVRFTGAVALDDNWLHLEGVQQLPDLPPFPRGLQVRISEIVWAADAPEGS